MNFYLTLPSTASMLEFPDNRQNNYTTLIKNPIILNGSYEVALTEITYSSMLKIHLGLMQIPNPFCTNVQSADRVSEYVFELYALNGEETASFFKKLNQRIAIDIICGEYAVVYNYAFGETTQNMLDIQFNLSVNNSVLILKTNDSSHYELVWDTNYTGTILADFLAEHLNKYNNSRKRYQFDNILFNDFPKTIN